MKCIVYCEECCAVIVRSIELEKHHAHAVSLIYDDEIIGWIDD